MNRRDFLVGAGAAVLLSGVDACGSSGKRPASQGAAPEGTAPPSIAAPATSLKPVLRGLADMGGKPEAGYDSVVTNWIFVTHWADLQPASQNQPIVTSAPTYTYAGAQVQKTGLSLHDAIEACRAAGQRGKLRVLCGEFAPEWAKNLPYVDASGKRQVNKPIRTATGTCGPFWQAWDPHNPHAGFQGAYYDLNVRLAALYDRDPVVAEVACSCTNAQTFSEAFVRQYTKGTPDLANLWAAGLTGNTDKASIAASLDAVMAAWSGNLTRVSIAIAEMRVATGPSTYDTDDQIAITIATNARARYGRRFLGGYESFKALSQGGSGTHVPYYDWLRANPPAYVQTVAEQKFTGKNGGLVSALQLAKSSGYAYVELHPGQYNSEAQPQQLAQIVTGWPQPPQ